MDQTWLANATEAAAWARAAGLDPQAHEETTVIQLAEMTGLRIRAWARSNRQSARATVVFDFSTFPASCRAAAWMCCCGRFFRSIAMTAPPSSI